MPAKYFECPTGEIIEISACLKECQRNTRCLFLPTLRAVAKSLDRGLPSFTITELISGSREVFLRRKEDYVVNPVKRLYALHGTAFHAVNDGFTQGEILSEERLYGEQCSGQFDVYGAVLDESTETLGDLKVASSYKLMKALGIYRVDVPTGEVYKTGPRKGEIKTVKQWRHDGVRHIYEWSVQLNFYRTLVQAQGLAVKRMVIQALCRDAGLRVANERGIDREAYLIDVNPISNQWIFRYVNAKTSMLQKAMETGIAPPPCRPRERWHGRKCRDYCDVAAHCDYGRQLTGATESAA